MIPHLNDRVYIPLKYGAQIILPAAATLYLAVATIWGFPNTEQIVGTITAVNTFLGVVLGLSSKAYNKSVVDQFDGAVKIVENHDEGKGVVTFVLSTEPEDLQKKDTATFKVE